MIYKFNKGSCVKRCKSGDYSNITLNELIKYQIEKANQFFGIKPINFTFSFCNYCSKNCLECEKNSDHCTKCSNQKYLYKNKCLNYCPHGTFILKNHYTDEKFCFKCDPLCESCK